MRHLTTIAVALAASAVAATTALLPPAPLAAQKNGGGTPSRPRLAASADTNDAVAYFDYGNLPDTPWKKSQDAFYWAYRLDPRQPVFLLAQREARWYKQAPEWRYAYYEGAQFVLESKESKELDSLDALVFARDPFTHFAGATCNVPSWMDDVDDPVARGTVFYERTCFKQAADEWAKALAKRPGLAGLRIQRAKALHFSNANGYALQELQTALDTLRGRDTKKLRHFYESKEWLEYMIGLIQIDEENYAAAREAFGRALAENLSFYQAHARLGDIAMLQSDPVTALAEYDQAVQLRGGDDPVLRDNYGVALLRAGQGHAAEAEAQFRKAVELAPEYANPYFNLAVALANEGRKEDAIVQFREFVSRAPRRYAGMIESANKNVAVLQAAAPGAQK